MSDRKKNREAGWPGCKEGTMFGDRESWHPVLEAWFRQRFGMPTDIQVKAWERIAAGEHVLLAAPTGSGKTLAALLPCLNRIVQQKRADITANVRALKPAAKPAAGVRLLYVTPLKALNNDIRDHLIEFLDELNRLGENGMAAEAGAEPGAGAIPSWPSVRVGVRTGDTSQSTRASMLRNPPDVLITTPESLYILLTSMKGREMLAAVEQIIVDEIHDLADGKRGMHLSLSLERLEHNCGRKIQRIGLSATMKPLDLVAQFLGGWGHSPSNELSSEPAEHAAVLSDPSVRLPSHVSSCEPRPVSIIESGMPKQFEVVVTMPEVRLTAPNRTEIWTPLLERMNELMEGCHSVLVFVNNRRLSERLTQQLNEFAGFETARSHHGSMSRERRLESEQALKEGAVRILVATSSLELGIDVGHVELVIQIDSPLTAASGIQRIGRAGHSVGGISRGAIIVRNRGQLAECAVLAQDIATKEIEELRIPEGTIDVLCQHIQAMVGVQDWRVDELVILIRHSDSYRHYTQERIEQVLLVLAGYYPHCRPALEWDRATGLLRRLRHTQLTALNGAGTIPQGSAYPVHHIDSRVHLGELDEEYIHESRVGDVFQLGSASYRIRSIKGDRVYVSEAENSFSEIPFWRGSGMSRSYSISVKIGALLGELSHKSESEDAESVIRWLTQMYGMDLRSAESLLGLVQAQKAVSSVPTERRIVIEQYTDDAGRRHLVLHSLFGRKLNRTWQLALQRYIERHRPIKLHTSARDNGIEFVFLEGEATLEELLLGVRSDNVEELLVEAIPSSPLFGIAFRHLAEAALLLQRGFTRVPMWKQRLRSAQLLQDSLPYMEQFPFIAEAMKQCLYEELETERLKQLLRDIEAGLVRVEFRHTAYPSPFAAQFVWDFVNVQMYESDAVPKEIQYRLLSVSRQLAGQLFQPSAYQELLDAETAQAWVNDIGAEGEFVSREPAARLTRLLKEQGDLTEQEIRNRLGDEAMALATIESLRERGAIARIRAGGESRWISGDEEKLYKAFPASEESVSFIIRRYAERQIALTAELLTERYAIDRQAAEEWIERLASEGRIERSPFAESSEDEVWTSRRAASRLLRFSLGRLRSRAKPVEPERYAVLLMKLQHLDSDNRLNGAEGLLTAIESLQGLFLPVSSWESHIFPSRIADYRKELLDLLCASGDVIWIGRKEEGEKEGRIAFFLAESKELYTLCEPLTESTREPELLELLQAKGASFVTAISRELELLPSELMPKLLQLVWEGRVSNDQYAPIRLHGKSAPSRSQAGHRKFQSGLGRWYAITPAKGGAKSNAENPEKAEKASIAWIHHLLKHFGVVTRDMLNRQTSVSSAQMQDTVRRLEDWGMVVRGLWVEGIPYTQLSTSETVELLKQSAPAWGGQTIVLSSIDPANPYGAMLSWPEVQGVAFSRKPGNYLVFREGRWLLWVENNGKRITVLNPELAGKWEGQLREVVLEALRVIMRRSGLRKIVVESWNGKAASAGEAAAAFRHMGAEIDRTSFVLWPSTLAGRYE